MCLFISFVCRLSICASIHENIIGLAWDIVYADEVYVYNFIEAIKNEANSIYNPFIETHKIISSKLTYGKFFCGALYFNCLFNISLYCIKKIHNFLIIFC